MGDSEAHQLATLLRKAAQDVESGNYLAVGLAHVTKDGQARTFSAARNAGATMTLLGAMWSLMAQQREIRQVKEASRAGGPRIAAPTPSAVADINRNRGRDS